MNPRFSILVLLTLFISCAGETPPAPEETEVTVSESPELPSDEALAELEAIPYLATASTTVDSSSCGVKKLDPKRVFDGYNLFQDYENEALLMDMKGKIVHVWSLPSGRMEFVRLLPDGSLLGVATNLFFRLRGDATPIFAVHDPFHHDTEPLPDGTFLVLSKTQKMYNGHSVYFDVVDHRDQKGALLNRWSTWDAFDDLRQHHKPSPLDRPGPKKKSQDYDYYHLNTIRRLPDTPLGRRDARFQEGNWLLCSRHTDLIFIVDPKTGKVVWSWGPGELEWPHAPIMEEDGTILLFDNGTRRHYTRLLRLNPENKTILWEYKGDPPKDFYSGLRGLAQPLPNGNILVTDSEKARVFEITSEGELVWDYYHSNIVDGNRHSIYRMLRIPRAEGDALLARNKPNVPESSLKRRQCAEKSKPLPVVRKPPSPPPPGDRKIDLSRATLTMPPVARGSAASLFDGNDKTPMISKKVNPASIVLVFPRPVNVGVVRLLVGQPGDASDRNDWWVETADSLADLESKSGSFQKVMEPHKNVGGQWDQAELKPARLAAVWRITVHRMRRDDYVHIYELEMFRQ